MAHMNILVAGSTGLVGSFLLGYLAADKAIEKAHLLLRHDPKQDSPKFVKHYIDFNDLDKVEIDEPIQAVVSCLGTTQKKSGKEGLYKVDHDYVVDLAKWAAQMEVPKFIVVSSIGANSRSFSYYLKVKGRMEEDIQKLSIPSIYILRPSLLLGPREEYRPAEVIGEKVLNFLRPVLKLVAKNQVPVHARNVAKAIHELCYYEEKKVMVLHSPDIMDISVR